MVCPHRLLCWGPVTVRSCCFLIPSNTTAPSCVTHGASIAPFGASQELPQPFAPCGISTSQLRGKAMPLHSGPHILLLNKPCALLLPSNPYGDISPTTHLWPPHFHMVSEDPLLAFMEHLQLFASCSIPTTMVPLAFAFFLL